MKKKPTNRQKAIVEHFVKKVLSESEFKGIDKKIKNSIDYLNDLQELIDSGKHRRDINTINGNLIKIEQMILECLN